MRALLLGANGFIGQAVLAALRGAGHEVVAVIRPGAAAPPGASTIHVDIATATSEDWRAHLDGMGAIVNCAGLLQSGPGRSVEQVHVDGAATLYSACEQLRIRRVIHVSAIGVDREQPSEFSRTKLKGDKALMARDLDWVILRPSVVVGRAAYGGSALFRGLAALPVLPVLPGTGALQIVQLDDLVSTILFFLQPQAPVRIALDVAGPERLSFADVVLAIDAGSAGGSPISSHARAGLRRSASGSATLRAGSAGARRSGQRRAARSRAARSGTIRIGGASPASSRSACRTRSRRNLPRRRSGGSRGSIS